jgi:8-oxo-dGTP pyrophosphatase MutT (NUDIX family)
MDTANNEFSQFPFATPQVKLTKGEKPKNLRLTIAAGGMIFAHNKILLNRSESNDLWSIPGGIVRFDEGAKSTVVREIKEELNLDVEVLDTIPYIFHFKMESEKVIDNIYLMHFLVKVKKPVRIRIGSDIIDYKWEPIGGNYRDTYPNVKPAVDYFMKI